VWIILIAFSALCLGIYDIFQKIALKDNALIPVLFLAILSSSLILTPVFLISTFSPESLVHTPFYVPPADFKTHVYIFLKALLVLGSWIFAYAGMKHLPLTIVTPIKSTQPIWTVTGAMLIFSERLNLYQTIGVIVTLVSFYLFSLVGKKEGVSFRTNKWVWFVVFGVLFGAASGLYDKYLLNKLQLDRMTVQVFFSYYQVLIMGIVMLTLWYPQRKKSTPFTWKWSIVLISIFLIASDFLYFYALSLPDALIAVISPLRRTGLVVAFFYGAFFFKERNLKAKLFCLAGLLIGVYFLFLGSIE
jgi:transporter family protein